MEAADVFILFAYLFQWHRCKSRKVSEELLDEHYITQSFPLHVISILKVLSEM